MVSYLVRPPRQSIGQILTTVNLCFLPQYLKCYFHWQSEGTFFQKKQKKIGPFPASFFFFVFSTVNSKYDHNKVFADDWIRTEDLWYWKKPLCQLPNTKIIFVRQKILLKTLSRAKANFSRKIKSINLIDFRFQAVRAACQQLKERMSTVASNLQGAKWHELVGRFFLNGGS